MTEATENPAVNRIVPSNDKFRGATQICRNISGIVRCWQIAGDDDTAAETLKAFIKAELGK